MTLCDKVRLTISRMKASNRLMLQKHRETIVKDLEANDVLDELYSEKVLTFEETEKIKAQVH